MKIVACFVISYLIRFLIVYGAAKFFFLNRNQCLKVLCKNNGDRVISRYIECFQEKPCDQ